MKNVYGYIRVSTAKQGNGVSLEAQKDAIARYAEQHGLLVARWFEEKETAAKQGRPVFTSMIKALKEGGADGLVLHKIDRGARNLNDWLELITLSDQGIKVYFAHENLDLLERGGRLAADIQLAVASDYIRNLRQEAIKGLYARLKQGIYPFDAPMGYRNNGKGKHKTIDPMQGPLVRKAFELYATRKYGLHALLARMHVLDLRNSKGKKVALTSLSIMLNNPFYAGIIRVKGQSFKGGHEALITTSLFNRVQAILRGKTNGKVYKHEFTYSKRIKCHHCKMSMIAENQKGLTYYRCHTKGCPTKGMRETTLENLLHKGFALVQLQPEEMETLKTILTEAEADSRKKHDELIEAIKLRKGQIDSRIDKLVDVYLEGGLDKQEYEERRKRLLFESKAQEEAEAKVQKTKSGLFDKTRKFLELCCSLIKSYESGILEEKRELLELVTSNLEISGKKLMISMRSPFHELAKRHEFQSGALERGKRRITYEPFVYSDINTSPILGKPLSRSKLLALFHELLALVAQLPGDSFKNEYGL